MTTEGPPPRTPVPPRALGPAPGARRLVAGIVLVALERIERRLDQLEQRGRAG